jgi:hypothetical protein
VLRRVIDGWRVFNHDGGTSYRPLRLTIVELGGARQKLHKSGTFYPVMACSLVVILISRAVLCPVHEATSGCDGFVSLEVSPYLAMSTKATIAEAWRLREAVHRDNLMIKVPATKPGVPAIRQLIAERINVNITLPLPEGLRGSGRGISRRPRALRWPGRRS